MNDLDTQYSPSRYTSQLTRPDRRDQYYEKMRWKIVDLMMTYIPERTKTMQQVSFKSRRHSGTRGHTLQKFRTPSFWYR